MRIAQLAERCNVATSTLRYYERRGLLPARRSPAGYRLYDGDSVERLRFISAAKRLGLGLTEITELLDVWRDGACVEVKATYRHHLAERYAKARARSFELDDFASTLRRTLTHLDTLPDRSGPCDGECAFLDGAHDTSSVVACSLNAHDQGGRISRWRDLLRDGHRAEIPGGLRVELPTERAAQAAELAVAEQRCCPFFTFTLQLQDQTAHLEVRAPAEARSWLFEVFGGAGSGDSAEPEPACSSRLRSCCSS